MHPALSQSKFVPHDEVSLIPGRGSVYVLNVSSKNCTS